jgi:spermidine synthase
MIPESRFGHLFTASEIALARLGLGGLSGADLDVLIGGLGLGYTAPAGLEHEAVRSVVIVEAFDAVIDWKDFERAARSN